MVRLGRRAFLGVFALAVLVSGAALAVETWGSVAGPIPSNFTVNGKTFQFTYIASNEAQREAGLMNRKITNDTTMLFAWPSPGYYSFYMRDTNASLDMIWISANGSQGRVVYIKTDAPPCIGVPTCPLYTPTSPANYVIEARAGFVSTNGVTLGTELGFA
ncbi:MAG: DUF192 domain-containing protein [archaeon]|nr:MAG: DUF192 domain-containing protein [archaeon]